MNPIRERSSTMQLLIGIALTEGGAVLFGCGEWDDSKTGTRLLFYAAGYLLIGVGMFLIWKEPISAIIIEDEVRPIDVIGNCKYLGRIDLNGHCFEAYQEEASHGGKRFRLEALPQIGPEYEAAVIRYLIHEGFIERRWPRISGKIQEEDSWAFLF